MHYYAKTGDNYYRLFSIREGRGREPHNDYMKWSTTTDRIGHPKFANEFTVHPTKIAIKRAVGHDNKLSYGKNSGQAYETLYNFGFSNPKRQLARLWTRNISKGFAGQQFYTLDQLKQKSEIVSFPADPLRPYWISAYFTTLQQEEISDIFAAERLDHILYYAGEFGNLVTLFKFVQPEWELLGIESVDDVSHWNHPTFHLKQKYDL